MHWVRSFVLVHFLRSVGFGSLFHVHCVSFRLVLQVVGAVAAFVMVLPLACCVASLACVPPWYVNPTTDASVPIVVVLVQGRSDR